MITKEKLIETIKQMPDEKFYNIENLLEEIILLEKIEISLQAAARGEVYTEEEAHKIMSQW
jgi:predicted transcriptional regulator